jgi:hypothetical protein
MLPVGSIHKVMLNLPIPHVHHPGKRQHALSPEHPNHPHLMASFLISLPPKPSYLIKICSSATDLFENMNHIMHSATQIHTLTVKSELLTRANKVLYYLALPYSSDSSAYKFPSLFLRLLQA